MAVLQDLISQISDPVLRQRIAEETEKLSRTKKFGLVFEEHLAECTALYDLPIRVGSSVAKKAGFVRDVYEVEKIDGDDVQCKNATTNERANFKRDELVVVAQFGEPIYPYLKPIDRVCNAPENDLWHTLIEADNYHALQLLEYLYAGKVDCIYIDPPYNTGARDWKYNNDYVDGADAYRHSKWLSMMEKRLKLAKKLLNPKDSVLIVTIDEKEYLHLGCLLEEIFPDANIQMVSTLTARHGTSRFNSFSRTNEFIYFVMIGNYTINAIDDIKYRQAGEGVYWGSFRRSNPTNIRTSRPNQFYPVYIEKTSQKIVKVGDPIPPIVDRSSVPEIDGCVAVFPVRDDGTEMLWCLTPNACRKLVDKGYIKVTKFNPDKPQQFSISYLSSGTIHSIESGKAAVKGYDEKGSIIAELVETKKALPKTLWTYDSHDAQDYGTRILKNILGEKKFDFPKSLYAVKDALKVFVLSKPNALIVDFFAGSGTTLHAVNLLNAEDGGRRRCVLVTNNEVSDAEAKSLSARGHHPGDDEWEKLGIARYVTWPRTVCSIEGHDVNGSPLRGNYLGSDRPMADGFKANAAYFKLGFLDKSSVALGRQFSELLSILWMKSGAYGAPPELSFEKLPDMLVLPENKFAVLLDESAYPEFLRRMEGKSEISTIYFITDSEPSYRNMAANFDARSFQLYRDYLNNFRINTGR